jgi:hypothetical protein
MSDYRVFVFDTDDGHLRTIQLDCRDDKAAIESAKQFVNGQPIELWQRDRPVAKIGSMTSSPEWDGF